MELSGRADGGVVDWDFGASGAGAWLMIVRPELGAGAHSRSVAARILAQLRISKLRTVLKRLLCENPDGSYVGWTS